VTVFLAILRPPWYTGERFSLWSGMSMQACAIHAIRISLTIGDSTPAHPAA